MPDHCWQADGLWIIGDRQPRGHPGRINTLLYKSWVARPERYRGDQYLFKDRRTENRWEFVQVFEGCHESIVVLEEEPKRFPLEYPESVDIPPESMRRWRLPDDQCCAYGATILRTLESFPIYPGAGTGYEFCAWDENKPQRLRQPFNLESWRLQFVELFGGQIDCIVGNQRYTLTQRDHLFIQSPVRAKWERISVGTKGVALFVS